MYNKNHGSMFELKDHTIGKCAVILPPGGRWCRVVSSASKRSNCSSQMRNRTAERPDFRQTDQLQSLSVSSAKETAIHVWDCTGPTCTVPASEMIIKSDDPMVLWDCRKPTVTQILIHL